MRSTRRPWASAPATSATCRAGCREMVRVVKPGGRVVILEITTPQKPPLSTFFSLWFDRLVPLLGRFDEAYTYLPSSVKRFPGPEPRWRGELAAGGLRATSAGSSRARRDHRAAPRDGRVRPRVASAEAVAAVVEAGGAHVPGADARPGGPAGRGRATHTGRRSASTRARRSPRAASGCGRCWCSSPPGPIRPGATPRCGPRSPSSSSIRRRWCTTTCWTPPCCGAADRRSWRRAGRSIATATGDLLFSRAFAELAGGGTVEPVRVLSDASSALVQGELLQREDAWKLQTDARALPAPLRSQDRAAVPRRVRAGRAGRRRQGRAAGRVRRADRAGVPAARRRARRERPGRADGQAPRHRPAGRDGDAAADHRARARSGAGRARPARGADTGAGRGRVRRDRRDGRAGSGPRGGAGDGRRREGGPAVPAGTVPAGGDGAGGRLRGRPLQPRSLRAGSRWRPGRRRSARLRPPCSPARGGAGP